MSSSTKNSTPRAGAGTSATGAAERAGLARGTLVAAALGVLVVQITMAIPAVLNGQFQQDFGTTSAQLTWITAAFLIPVTLLELTFGVLGDLFGRKRLLVWGAGLMAVGLVIALLTPGTGSATGLRVSILVIGQVITGIGAAAMLPSTLAMVTAGTHTPRDRARALSTWSAALVSGAVISPVLGGWAAGHAFRGDEFGGWRWAFGVCLVLSVISLVVSQVAAVESSSPEGRTLDWGGQVTIALSLFALLYAVIQGPTSGWDDWTVIGGFVLAVVFFVAFVAIEKRVTGPLLQLDLFKNRAFAVAAVITVLGMFAYLGTGYSASIRLSAIQGFTPLKTSIAFVLLYAFALLLAPVVSRVMHTVNPRFVLVASFLLIAIGDIWVSRIPITDDSYSSLVVPLVVIGIGFAFAVSGVTGVTVNTVPNHLAGMASGTTSMLRDLGFTLAPVVLGAIALSKAAGEIADKVAANPTLQQAVAAFNGAPTQAPADQRAALEGAVGAVNSGPLGANAIPSSVPGPDGVSIPFNPLKDTAFTALGNAYSLSWLICGLAALAAALLAVVALGGKPDDTLIAEESLAPAA
jgi:MFS family permease